MIPDEAVPVEVRTIIQNEIAPKLTTILKTTFAPTSIKFRKYTVNLDINFAYQDQNIIYFTEGFLNSPHDSNWKQKMLGKCLQIKNVNPLQIIQTLAIVI